MGNSQVIEHESNGVNFMFTEPLASWRKVHVRRTKTMIDWAEEIRELLDIDIPKPKR